MSLEFKKISGSTPYLLNSASTAEELTLALEDYMRTGTQIIFQHDGEDCILSSFEYKADIESTVIAYFISPKKKLVKVDVATGFDLVITESEFTPETDTTLTQSGKPADAKAVGDALDELNDRVDNLPSGTTVELDASLTDETKAAQAKAVGDKINALAVRVTAVEITDPTLTQENKAANAKAVGDTLKNYASKTYVDSAVANAGGGGGASGGSHIIEVSGSFGLPITVTAEQEEQMTNNFTNVVVHLTVDGILYVLQPLSWVEYPTYGVTALDDKKVLSTVLAAMVTNYGLLIMKNEVDLSSIGTT